MLKCAWLQARYFSGTCCSCAQHMEHYSPSMPCPLILPTACSWDSPAFAQPHTEPTQPRAALVSPSTARCASHGQVWPATCYYISPMSPSTPHPYLPLVPHTAPSCPRPHTDAPMGTRTGAFLLSPPVTPPSPPCIASFLCCPLSRISPWPYSGAPQFCCGCAELAPDHGLESIAWA